MKRVKEKESFFEDERIDTVQMAKDIMEESQKKMEKNKKGMCVGAVSVIGSVIGVILLSAGFDPGVFIMLITAILSLVSYIIGGGIGIAFKFAWKACKITWYVVPSIFFLDVLAAVDVFAIALIAFLYVPILFIWLSGRQSKKDYEAAENYLKYAK